jgi:hypothetical protein
MCSIITAFLTSEFPDSIFNTSKDDLRQRFNQATVSLTASSNNKEREGLHYDAKIGLWIHQRPV